MCIWVLESCKFNLPVYLRCHGGNLKLSLKKGEYSVKLTLLYSKSILGPSSLQGHPNVVHMLFGATESPKGLQICFVIRGGGRNSPGSSERGGQNGWPRSCDPVTFLWIRKSLKALRWASSSNDITDRYNQQVK